MAASADYDRIAELKAFDESKAGVKGVVDSGIKDIPRMFHAPPHFLAEGPHYSPDDPNFIVPVIDLEGGCQDPQKRNQIVTQIRDACKNWGFFQILNHGVPVDIMEEMVAGVHRFFDLDVDQKKAFYGSEIGKKVVYGSNFNLYDSPAANWRDSVLYLMEPNPPNPEELPVCSREIVPKYSDEVMKLGDLLCQLLSEALGLSSNHLKDMDCLKVLGLACNYHPPCPQPELTLGTTEHTDISFFTVILQDHFGGLQILHNKHWVDVPFVPGGLVVNMGDMLQLISNDKLSSVVHRVRVKNAGPRVSVVGFFGHGASSSSRVYGPIQELLSEENPPIYQETTSYDLFIRSVKQGFEGKSVLSQLKL